MNIGEAAARSGVSAKMIRHYEEQGIIPRASRSSAGYRRYSDADVHTLRFVKRARELGFSMQDIRQLVGLWRNKRRSSSEVKRIAGDHIRNLEQKIKETAAMLKTLRHLTSHCHGDARPECPILDELAL
jgi:Cu(I)-responsive transcriptional regulator